MGPEIDRATNRVKLTLVAEPARRAYVRRINISGNERTKDDIIRREFRQMESALRPHYVLQRKVRFRLFAT